MEGVELIEPTDFFNILNQEMTYPMLSDPCYLLLFDTRSLAQYMEDHIITAQLVQQDEDGEFQIPMDAEVETKRKIVVYDDNTSDTLTQNSTAVAFAKHLWDNGSKYPVKIINGGFQEFSAHYPFLRTQEMLYTPQQMDNLFTYPVEVIPKFLYVGNHNQSQVGRVNKDLKVKAHVNVSTRHDGIFGGRLEIPGKDNKLVPALLEIVVEDKKGEDLFVHFEEACSFIDSHNVKDGRSVLVFSDLGISRSIALAIAYLMHSKKWSLEVAWDHMKKCKSNMCPNRSFVEQLSAWEEQLFGKKMSDMNTIEPY